MHDFLVTPVPCEEDEKNCGFEMTWRERNRNNCTLRWVSML
jgi:hypothetical protein